MTSTTPGLLLRCPVDQAQVRQARVWGRQTFGSRVVNALTEGAVQCFRNTERLEGRQCRTWRGKKALRTVPWKVRVCQAGKNDDSGTRTPCLLGASCIPSTFQGDSAFPGMWEVFTLSGQRPNISQEYGLHLRGSKGAGLCSVNFSPSKQ